MLKWLHHLFNPHCRECQLAAEENKVCQSCETVKMQLAIVNAEKRQLLELIVSLTKPAEIQAPSPQIGEKESVTKLMSWRVQRQMLEAEDRKKAQILAEFKKSSVDAQKAAQVANPISVHLPVNIESKSLDDRTQSIEQLEKELGIEEVKNAQTI
jgi:hypothetical protein